MNGEALKLGAGLKLIYSDRFSIDATYTGEFGDRSDTEAGGVSLRWKF